jgi:transcription antitermination factor NusG
MNDVKIPANQGSRKWYVLYTKPRNEKKVTERLSAAGYEIYCPVIRTLRQWSDRKKKVSLPMFPSYVFSRVDENERQLVVRDPGVLNFVFWLGKPAEIRDREIDAIRNIESRGADIRVEGGRPEPGQYVAIPEGPFRGMTGRVDKVDRTRMLIYIEQLGCVVMFKYS